MLLVDDSDGFLATARRVLEREGLQVVGTAANGDEARRKAIELSPDVALVDIDLGSESGFDVVRQLAGGSGALDVVLISSHSPDDFADLIAASPAVGFVSKSRLSARAIERALRGHDGR